MILTESFFLHVWSVIIKKEINQWMSQSRLTCAGGGVAFTQSLCQLGHLAAYLFVAAEETIFRDGVILRSCKGSVIILLRKSEEEGGVGWTKEKAVTYCICYSKWSWAFRVRKHGKETELNWMKFTVITSASLTNRYLANKHRWKIHAFIGKKHKWVWSGI